jgi:hypothetical protein
MLRKNILRWILLSMLFAPGAGVAGQTPAKGAEAFLPESVYEFQPVLEGTEVVHEFVLQNRGEAPLNILQIKSG